MEYEFARCARCEKVFQRIRSVVCHDCLDAEEADYAKIRDVLNRQPNLNVQQTAEAAEVDVDCVLRMLNEGLITNAALSNPVTCGRCGAPAISLSKRLCEKCLLQLDTEVAHALAEAHEAMKAEQARLTVHETVEVKRKNLQDEPQTTRPESILARYRRTRYQPKTGA